MARSQVSKQYYGLKVNKKENNGYEVKQTSAPVKTSINTVKKVNYQISLLNVLPLKNVEANILPQTTVVPIGKTIGLKLYTDGVLVVGMSEIKNINNQRVKPYESSGIKEGDRIVAINEKSITCTVDLVECLNDSKGNTVTVKYIRDENEYSDNMMPAQTSVNEYKLALWVRDAQAGVGTLSFYEPATKSFAALGHGIVDIDTGGLVTIANGNITTANILNVLKGEKGRPGEIRGSLLNQNNIGMVSKNTVFGIYGKLTDLTRLDLKPNNEIPVATREEIKQGKAKILCSLENNKTEEYEIEIEKIFTNNNIDNKSMTFKVTDDNLLQKTGGIIQGMSGSPIIQNGKLIGVVTHVFVNNPQMGYGVFADIMIKKMKEVD